MLLCTSSRFMKVLISENKLFSFLFKEPMLWLASNKNIESQNLSIKKAKNKFIEFKGYHFVNVSFMKLVVHLSPQF